MKVYIVEEVNYDWYRFDTVLAVFKNLKDAKTWAKNVKLHHILNRKHWPIVKYKDDKEKRSYSMNEIPHYCISEHEVIDFN